MKRNPSKYQAIVIGKTPVIPKCYCENPAIPNSEELEMLGVIEQISAEKSHGRLLKVSLLRIYHSSLQLLFQRQNSNSVTKVTLQS